MRLFASVLKVSCLALAVLAASRQAFQVLLHVPV